MVKYLLSISSIVILFSCNSVEAQVVKGNPLILDFPSYSDSLVYSGCYNVSKPINIEIYSDSLIDLNAIDDRLSIKFKFNWLLENEWPNKIGITSIDIIKNDNVISNMDFSYVKLEAFMNNDPNSKRFMQMKKSVYLEDVNMDSYLDLTIRWNSRGKKSYWLYNPKTEIFEFYEELNHMDPYYIDCKNNIIYSYEWGGGYGMSCEAYKIDGINISLIQSKEISYKKKFNIVEYSDALGTTISIDTIYRD